MKKIPIVGTLAAALAASLCCVCPALLAALGLGGLGATALLVKSHWILYGVGIVILGATLFLLRKQKSIVSLILILSGLFYCLHYGLTHKVASWLYQHQPISYQVQSPSETHTALVSVSGMTCIACARGIEAYLKNTQGVVDAQVSFDKKKALVCFDSHKLSRQDLEKRIGETGYSGKIISETVCTRPGLPGGL